MKADGTEGLSSEGKVAWEESKTAVARVYFDRILIVQELQEAKFSERWNQAIEEEVDKFNNPAEFERKYTEMLDVLVSVARKV
jgi:hypothetical protein